MIKYLLFFTLILAILGIAQRMAKLTIKSNIRSLEWVAKAQARQGSGAEIKHFNSYPDSYYTDLKDKLTQSKKVLSMLVTPLLYAILLVLFIALVVCYKAGFILKKNDGLAMLIFPFVLAGSVFSSIDFIYSKFQDASAATNDFQLTITVVLLICSPLLFLLAHLLHKKEITLGLQHRKWLANIALGFFVITALFALFIGVASISFDLGGHWG